MALAPSLPARALPAVALALVLLLQAQVAAAVRKRGSWRFSAGLPTSEEVAGSLQASWVGEEARLAARAAMRKLHPDVDPDRVIVSLSLPPRALGGSDEGMAAERRSFFAGLRSRSITYRLRYQYRTLLNAVVLELPEGRGADVEEEIAGMPGVERVSHVRLVGNPVGTTAVQLEPSTEGPRPLLRFAHNMTNVNRVQRQLNLTGRGIRVGVIDTGVDYTHPAFGSCARIGAGCRVAFGTDFVGDAYGTGSNTTPLPDNDPMDCEGHGTHVAGIIGANDSTVTGVAPGVTLGAYRIFGCNGGTATDVIIAAMDRAANDGMDIINLSLGAINQWPQDELALAADRLMNRGVLVFAAFGNSGASGLWSGGTPGVTTRGVGVGSFDNQFYLGGTFEVGSGPSRRQVKFAMDPSQRSKVQAGDIAVSSTNGCSSYGGAALFLGKIVLVQRGTCPGFSKALNAQAAGAIGVAIYNSFPGPMGSTVAGTGLSIPVATISQEDGVELIRRSQAGAVQVTWLPGEEVLPVPSGGQVSAFSSWGPVPGLVKPDLGAPGGLIFSTVPVSKGSYAVYSGTSMATPYAAGVAALYLSQPRAPNQARPAPATVKTALMNSAVPAVLRDTTSRTPVAKQGAGLIDALQAILGRTTVTPASLSLTYLPTGAGSASATITISYRGTGSVAFDLSHVAATSVNGTSPQTPGTDATRTAQVRLSTARVTISAGRSATATVTVTLANGAQQASQFWVYSGFIRVQPVGQSSGPEWSPVFVPYSLLAGGQQVLASGPAAPFMQSVATYGRTNAPLFSLPSQSASFTFNLSTLDIPVFFCTLRFPTPQIAARVFNAAGTLQGFAGIAEYVPLYDKPYPPNSANFDVVWAYPIVRPDPVRNPTVAIALRRGTYYLTLSVQKGFSSPSLTSSSVEVWRSPQIVVL